MLKWWNHKKARGYSEKAEFDADTFEQMNAVFEKMGEVFAQPIRMRSRDVCVTISDGHVTIEGNPKSLRINGKRFSRKTLDKCKI